jgi:hypothetical protein
MALAVGSKPNRAKALGVKALGALGDEPVVPAGMAQARQAVRRPPAPGSRPVAERDHRQGEDIGVPPWARREPGLLRGTAALLG